MSSLRNAVPLRVGAGVLALMWLVSCQIDKLFQSGGASDPPATRLEFAAPPNATAGEPLSPAVRVSAVDGTGAVDTTFRGAVTVTLGENPVRGTLRGTGTVDAVRGVATFADLRVNRAGTAYRLTASADQLAGATSDAFEIAAGPPTTGDLTVTTSTTGANLPTSYTVTVDGSQNRTIPANGGTTTYSGLSATTHTVALTDVPTKNCTVSGGASHTVTVAAGETATEHFSISCAATTGSLSVTTSTSGQSQDPDGYTFAVDNGTPQPIGVNQTITVTPVAAGSHTVVLAGVAGNCTVANGPSRTVTVPQGGSVEAAFSITCTQLTGSVTVTTSTSGGTPDPDGYTVAVTGAPSQHIDRNGTVTFADLAIGNHTVTLSGIASNCSVTGGASRTVTVATGPPVGVTFTIDCPTPPPLTGSLTVTTATTGSSQPTSYTVTVDGGSSRTIPANGGSTTYSGLSVTDHTVALTDVPANCTVTGGASKTVTVTAGGTATAAFTVSCTALTGSLTVTTATTGSSQPTSYTVTVDGGSSRTIPATGRSTASDGLSATDHTVALTDVPANCSVSGGASKT